MARTEAPELPILNDLYDEHCQNILLKHWTTHIPLHKHTSITSSNFEMISKPFRVCRISNFFKNPSFIDSLIDDLSVVPYTRNLTDLFHHEQTKDLVSITDNTISAVYKIFDIFMIGWMKKITNIKLNRISMSSASYSDADYLLCHDDNAGDRRIAFVLYLSRDWSEKYGGSLDLFDTDEEGLPRNIVHSFTPEFNSLIFFEVCDHSYHQVAEVTHPSMARLTINGWFHGSVIKTIPPIPRLRLQGFNPSLRDLDLSTWVNATYLNVSNAKKINQDIEQESFACLDLFITPEIYRKLSEELKSDLIKWNKVGPANLRNYEVADATSFTSMWKKVYDAFQSITFCELMEKYTELEIKPTETNPNPFMTIELQRWSKGCYTLICDQQVARTYRPIDNTIPNIDSTCLAPEELEALNNKHAEQPTMRPKAQLSESPNSKNRIEDEIVTSPLPKRRRSVKFEDEFTASCSEPREHGRRSPILDPDSDDSQVSNIRDYMSESDENSHDHGDDDQFDGPGTLDVIIQFHTSKVSKDDVIHYVDPTEIVGNQAHIVPHDNQLSIVYYKDQNTCRVHKYINHHFDGYFYNLICSFHEKDEN